MRAPTRHARVLAQRQPALSQPHRQQSREIGRGNDAARAFTGSTQARGRLPRMYILSGRPRSDVLEQCIHIYNLAVRLAIVLSAEQDGATKSARCRPQSRTREHKSCVARVAAAARRNNRYHRPSRTRHFSTAPCTPIPVTCARSCVRVPYCAIGLKIKARIHALGPRARQVRCSNLQPDMIHLPKESRVPARP